MPFTMAGQLLSQSHGVGFTFMKFPAIRGSDFSFSLHLSASLDAKQFGISRDGLGVSDM
jgi:hypothetical protein